MAIPLQQTGVALDWDNWGLPLTNQVNRMPLGIVARGNRTTSSSTTTTTVGVIRIDNITVTAGRIYRVWTSPLCLVSTVGGDDVSAQIRYSTAGSAGTGDTQLDEMRLRVNTGTGAPVVPFQAIYVPTSNATLSILLCVNRAGGSGSVNIFGAAGDPIDLVIEDDGVEPTDTGVDI